jgi:glycosyltransferase involved in cell wall biosynthesis
MSQPPVLINLANLRTGGVLQAGASFLDELARLAARPETTTMWNWFPNHVTVEVSHEIVAHSTADLTSLPLRVLDGGPSVSMRRALTGGRGHDVAFTLFGADYAPRRGRRLVVGFADATSLYPELSRPQSVRSRLRQQARRRASRAMFRRADHLIVESPHLVNALERRWAVTAPISVVPNVVNASVLAADESDVGEPGCSPEQSPTFFFPTRPYPHKNLDFLGRVGRIALERHGLRVTFVLTLDDAEWADLTEETRQFSVTVGPLRPVELATHYRSCTGVFFPSLLEGQSVTPLEALALSRPLLASDRPFVRSTVGDAAWYFDPEDASSAAGAMQQMLADPAERERRLNLGRELVSSWPSAADRAASYLDIIDSELRLARHSAR